MEIGYTTDEICNRDGCTGIIEQDYIDGSCSCHIDPPCSYCTTPTEFCPECNWEAREEQAEIDRAEFEQNKERYREQSEERHRKLKETQERWVRIRAGEETVDTVEYQLSGHTHFSMIKEGAYPEGHTLDVDKDRIAGSFGGRFVYHDKKRRTFKYIAYTD